MVGDVVAMGAARPRLEERRQIAVAHAELVEIGNQLGRLAQAEIAVELQPIGRARNPQAHARGRIGPDWHNLARPGVPRAGPAKCLQVCAAAPCLQIQRQLPAPAGIGRIRVPGRLGCSSTPKPSSICTTSILPARGPDRHRPLGQARASSPGRPPDACCCRPATGPRFPAPPAAAHVPPRARSPAGCDFLSGIELQPVAQLQVQTLPEPGKGRKS